jgi:hypothetical protein
MRRLGEEARRVGLEGLDENALGRDLAEDLPVGGARDGYRDGKGGAVAGEPNHSHVMAEVLAAELCADTKVAGQLEHLALELDVPEAPSRGR